MKTLKIILRINAVSCLLFGSIFAIGSNTTGQFLGDMPAAIIFALGIVLILNGLHLLGVACRKTPYDLEIIWFSLGDLFWWLASLFLITAGVWITTPIGIAITFVVGLFVAGLGVAQLWFLGLRNYSRSSVEHFVAITKSWLALPLWVRIWLFVLNAVFLYAIALWPDRISAVTLTAFVATGPLLMAQIAYDGGLRRILGLAHIIPWVPLLLWLFIQGETQIYTWILGGVLVPCLALDLFDVARFWRGERGVIGEQTDSVFDPV